MNQIYNFTDNLFINLFYEGDRLHNFTIYGSNTGFNPTQVTDLMLCNSQSEAMETGETKTFNCTHGSNNYIDAQ